MTKKKILEMTPFELAEYAKKTNKSVESIITRAGFRKPKRALDLNVPADAREFIHSALPDALPSKLTHVILSNGKRVDINHLTDEQAVDFAWQLLPIYQAKFPELVDIQTEH